MADADDKTPDNVDPKDADTGDGKPDMGPDGTPFDSKRAQAKINETNREAANLRKRLAEAEAIVEKYNKEQDEKKSEVDRYRDRSTALEAEKAKLTDSFNRMQVRFEKGLTEAQAKRLVGSTLEELSADADELVSAFGTTKTETKSTSKVDTPDPDEVSGGRSPRDENIKIDPRALAARIRRR